MTTQLYLTWRQSGRHWQVHLTIHTLPLILYRIYQRLGNILNMARRGNRTKSSDGNGEKPVVNLCGVKHPSSGSNSAASRGSLDLRKNSDGKSGAPNLALSSSKKRAGEDSVTIESLPKGKDLKKFCGHVMTDDFELASRVLFKVFESRPLKTLSKSFESIPFIDTGLSGSKAAKPIATRNLIDSKLVSDTPVVSSLIVDSFIQSKVDCNEYLATLEFKDKEIDRLRKREVDLLAKLDASTKTNLALVTENLALNESFNKKLQDTEEKMRGIYVKNQIKKEDRFIDL